MNSLKNTLCFLLCIAVVPLPTYATTHTAPPIISTMDAVNSMERENLKREIFELINENDLRGELAKSGLGETEISARIASLSHSEMRALKTDIQEARAGGILVTILVVILIIYLIQRI